MKTRIKVARRWLSDTIEAVAQVWDDYWVQPDPDAWFAPLALLAEPGSSPRLVATVYEPTECAARDALLALRRANRRIARMSAAEGFPDSYGRWVNMFARAIGAEEIYIDLFGLRCTCTPADCVRLLERWESANNAGASPALRPAMAEPDASQQANQLEA